MNPKRLPSTRLVSCCVQRKKYFNAKKECPNRSLRKAGERVVWRAHLGKSSTAWSAFIVCHFCDGSQARDLLGSFPTFMTVCWSYGFTFPWGYQPWRWLFFLPGKKIHLQGNAWWVSGYHEGPVWGEHFRNNHLYSQVCPGTDTPVDTGQGLQDWRFSKAAASTM